MIYDVIGLDVIVPVRFTESQVKLIKKILRKDKTVNADLSIGNISDFIRGATVAKIRQEKTRLKL